MKKVIAAVLFATVVLLPARSFAQEVTPVPVTQDQLRFELQGLLAQLIQFVAQLQAQLATQIEAETQKVGEIDQRTQAHSDTLERIDRNTKPTPMPTPTPEQLAPGALPLKIEPSDTILELANAGNYDDVNVHVGEDEFASADRGITQALLVHENDAVPEGFLPATAREVVALANQQNLSNITSYAQTWRAPSSHRYAVFVNGRGGNRTLSLIDVALGQRDLDVRFVYTK